MLMHLRFCTVFLRLSPGIEPQHLPLITGRFLVFGQQIFAFQPCFVSKQPQLPFFSFFLPITPSQRT